MSLNVALIIKVLKKFAGASFRSIFVLSCDENAGLPNETENARLPNKTYFARLPKCNLTESFSIKTVN